VLFNHIVTRFILIVSSVCADGLTGGRVNGIVPADIGRTAGLLAAQTASCPGSDWKWFSNNSHYRQTPSGRVPYGFQLDTGNAYVCIGSKEFSTFWYGNRAWTVQGVQQNAYTWRR
jgi:hypothetical protein